MIKLFDTLSKLAYIAELLTACAVFTLPLKKRAHPMPSFLLGAAVSVGVSIMLEATFPRQVIFTMLIYLTQLAVVVLPVTLCCDVSITDAIYGTVCAYAMQHFASSLYIFVGTYSQIINFSSGLTWITPASVPLYLTVYGGTYFACYGLFARQLADKGQYHADLRQIGEVTALIVPIALVLSPIGKLNGVDGSSFLLCQVYAILCSAFVLWVQTSQRKAIYWQRELAIQEQLWRQQKEQYQLSRENIDIINEKCHDLKHQVAALRSIKDEERREESLQEIERSVMLYDAAVQTGNEALDTVLTEKSLTCERRGIKWTCMADGSRLSFLDPVDLYAVFGNALDNAIEGVQALQDPEQRVITVTVFNRGSLAILQIENYFSGEPQLLDGLPKSTKGDDRDHGFGLRSIRRMAEKYGGSLTVRMEDHIFVLNIILPIPE